MPPSTAPPPPPLLTTHLSLVQTLTSYLTCAVHTLLYTRSLYPSTTFLLTRKYNTPLQQSRHPAVCAWINSSISHMQSLLLESKLRSIAFVVFSEQGEVMERWVFDIERMPVVGYRERFVEFEDTGAEELNKGIKVQDLEEQFRASIRKLQHKGEQMRKLPDGCTYTLAVELREGAEAPIGGTEKEQAWEVGDVGLQREEKREEDIYGIEDSFTEKLDKGKRKGGKRGKDLGGARTIAIKLVEAGEFVMEMWVEESQAKLDFENEGKQATVEDGDGD